MISLPGGCEDRCRTMIGRRPYWSPIEATWQWYKGVVGPFAMYGGGHVLTGGRARMRLTPFTCGRLHPAEPTLLCACLPWGRAAPALDVTDSIADDMATVLIGAG